MRLFSAAAALVLVACSGAPSPGIGGNGDTLPEAPARATPPSASTPAAPAPATDTPAPTTTPAGPKRMFVSVQLYAGDLRAYAPGVDGFTAGDAICAKEAANAKLGGAGWKAYLSGRKSDGSKVNAVDRILGDGPWLSVDGKTTIFDTRAKLGTEPLTQIRLSADGQQYRGEGPWTGTSRGVAADSACEDNAGTSWQSASTRARGLTGNPGDTSEWTDSGTIHCDEGAPLYCFEQ